MWVCAIFRKLKGCIAKLVAYQKTQVQDAGVVVVVVVAGSGGFKCRVLWKEEIHREYPERVKE